MSKYIFKDENHSPTYTKASKAVVAKANENSTCKSTLQKVMMAGMPRDVPRQEAFLILSKNLSHTKMSVKTVFVSLTGNKRINLKQSKKQAKCTSSQGIGEIYWRRDTCPNFAKAVADFEADEEAWRQSCHFRYKNITHPKDICLATFASFFNSDWSRRTERVSPTWSPYFMHGPPKRSNFKAFEDYARARLLQYLPGSTPDNVKGDFATFAEAIDHYVENDVSCPTVLREQVRDSIIKAALAEAAGEETANEGSDYEYSDEGEDFPDLHIPEGGK